MIVLHDTASMQEALKHPLAPIVVKRIEHTLAGGLAFLTIIVVVELGDTEAQLKEEIGFTPLVNPMDGSRYPAPLFQPWWDWLTTDAGWHEMIVTVGDSGFAFILLVEDGEGDLQALCREYAA